MLPLFGQLYCLLNICLILVAYSVNFANFIKSKGSLKEALMLRLCLRISEDEEQDESNMVNCN